MRFGLLNLRVKDRNIYVLLCGANTYCRHCSLLGLLLDKPLYNELQYSSLLLTSAFATEIETIFRKYCLILCRSQNLLRHDLLTVSTCFFDSAQIRQFQTSLKESGMGEEVLTSFEWQRNRIP